MNAANFPERHQEQMMISETNDFSERFAIAMGGLDAANLANGGSGAFGFDDEADQLHHASARFRDASRAHAFERGIQPVG